MKNKRFFINILIYAFLSIAFIVSVFPFYWMIAGMTNSAVDIINGKMTIGNEFFHNIKKLFDAYNMPRYIFNSVKISVLTVIGTLLVSSLAAYGFEFYPSKGKEKTYGVMLLSMMVPVMALMIPLFKLIVKLHLLDTHAGIILISVASVFIIFFFRQSYKTFPKEVIQAARVDGAGEFKIYYSIVMPSMKSTYAAAGIFVFMSSWNAYMWPLIMLQTDKQKTLTLLISGMSSAYFPEWGTVMTAIVIATIPSIVIFFSLQKYFVQGMTGSVKE